MHSVLITPHFTHHSLTPLRHIRPSLSLPLPLYTRQRAARTLAGVCARFGFEYRTLRARVMRQLVAALCDPSKVRCECAIREMQ